MRAWRAPALILIVAVLVAGAVTQHRRDDEARPPVTAADLDHLMPVAARPGAPSSTWFCAGGTATGRGDGMAEHTVTVANVSTADVQVAVTAVPSEGAAQSRRWSMAPGTRRDVVLSDLVKAPWAAALVEADGGEVGVVHQVRGANGQAGAPCSSFSGTRWYFPAGSTRRGTREILAVFNPFPDDAVVDLDFETDDGRRTPQAYQGLIVPGGRVLPVDITDVVTVRTQVAATATVRAGRVIVDQVQVSDGTDGQARGIGLTLGAPTPVANWVLPGGATLVDGTGVDESYVLFNPGDQPATVLVQVRTDDEAVRGAVEPYEVTVRARQYATVSLAQDRRVPLDVGRWTTVSVSDGPPVVVARVVQAKPDAPVPGLSMALGSPLGATRWLVPRAGGPGVVRGRVTVVNPSASDAVTVTLTAVRDGQRGPVEGFDARSVPAGGRVALDTERLPDPGATMLVVDASAPVVVSQDQQFGDPTDRGEATAVPIAPTMSLLAPPPVVTAGGGVGSGPAPSPLGDRDSGDAGSIPLPTPPAIGSGSSPGSGVVGAPAIGSPPGSAVEATPTTAPAGPVAPP